MKKLITSLISVIVIISILFTFAGCGGSGKKTESQEEPGVGTSEETKELYKESNQTPAGTYPIVYEKETLTIALQKFVNVTDMKDNEATRWLENKLNVNFEFVLLPDGNDQITKANLMISSGEKLPDIFLTSGAFSKSVVEMHGKAGTFLALDDLISKWGANLKKAFKEVPYIEEVTRATDGKVYAYPRYNEGGHDRYSQKMWINQAWLKTLGKDMPATTDEYYEVLKTFRDGDPNQNNKKDELPLVITTDAWDGDLFGFIMNPFIITTSKGLGYAYLENDEIKIPYDTDEWKEGLKYLNKLYTENLLDKECFVMKADQAKALIESQDGNRVGSIPTGYIGAVVDMSKPVPRDDFTVLPPLKGSKGLCQTPHSLPSVNPTGIVTKDAQSPITAFRVLDAMGGAVPEAMSGDPDKLEWLNFIYGPEGEAWIPAKSGSKGVGGSLDAYFKLLFLWGETTNWNWGNDATMLMPITQKTRMEEPQDEYSFEGMLYNESMAKMKPKGVECYIPPLSYKEDEAADVEDISLELTNYLLESWALFVTGEKDIDQNWDAYLSDIKNLGAYKLLEIKQNAYNEQFK